MLTAADEPTIRFAITRRLDKETGVYVLQVLVQPYAKGEDYLDLGTKRQKPAETDFVRVGVLSRLGDSVTTRSWFDLPDPFEHGHLLDEIDEISEQYKKARKRVFNSSLVVPERKVTGTGLRGRWARYAA